MCRDWKAEPRSCLLQTRFPQIELTILGLIIRCHVDEIDWILARIAGRAELAAFPGDGAYQARQAEICQRIGFNVLRNFFDRVTGLNQLFLRRRVDSIEARRQGRPATDPAVNFFRSRRSHHLHNLPACGPTYDRVIDENDALSREQFFHRIELHLHTEMADLRFRFDECSTDVVITDQTEREGYPRFL